MSHLIKDKQTFQFVWDNNGMHPEDPNPEHRIKVKDALATPNAGLWLPKIIQNIVKEAAEPLLVGSSLLTRVDWTYGQTITFPAIGALEADDIAEGQAYPEKQLQIGGATVTASVGKVGVAMKITEEMLMWSQFDLVNLHLRKAGEALARHKEVKIFNHINSMGVVTHDNARPLTAAFGVTTGRSISGAGNGSATMDDLFDAYSQILHNGYIPDTLLLHPLTWSMFVKDPVMRHLMMHGSGGGGVMFANWSGNVASKAPWGDNSVDGASGQNIIPSGSPAGATASPLEAYSQNMTSAPILPSYFPFPFRIIVSPFMPFDANTRLTDIMLFDSRNLGLLMVAQDVTVDQWNDLSVDITKLKLKERYGIGILEEGLPIAVMRNVKCVPNAFVESQLTATLDTSGWTFPLPAGTAVV